MKIKRGEKLTRCGANVIQFSRSHKSYFPACGPGLPACRFRNDFFNDTALSGGVVMCLNRKASSSYIVTKLCTAFNGI
jgi:hypothetical protein